MTKRLLLLVVIMFGFGITACELDSAEGDAGPDASTDAATDSGTDAGTDSGTDAEVDGGDGLPAACQPDATCDELDSSTCDSPCAKVCEDSAYVDEAHCVEGTRCYCLCTMGVCTHGPT
jgi:hypothetical protein